MLLSVLAAVAVTTSCTGGPIGGGPASVDTTQAKGNEPSDCVVSATNTQFNVIRRSRVATEAALVMISDQGNKRVIRLSGMLGAIRPDVLQASGPALKGLSVLRAFAARVPIAGKSGPSVEPVKSWTRERLRPGEYIVHTGADLVQAVYVTNCSRGLARGSLSTWTARATGILDCREVPPRSSTAHLVKIYC